MKIKFSSNKIMQVAILVALSVITVSFPSYSSAWGAKVSSASSAGAAEVRNVMQGVTQLLMGISAVAFLIGIVNAGYKYKMGDQQAFKSLQGVLIGSLVILIGVGLANLLFF